MAKEKFDECKEKCDEYEKDFGTIELMAIALSVTNKIIVEAGITTRKEIQDRMIEEIEGRRKKSD